MFDDVFLRRLDPAAVFGETAVGADGADDAAGRGLHLTSALDDEFKRAADMASAAVEETGGVRMAVESGVVRDAVFLDDLGGAAPVEEGFFDGGAVGVFADGAASRVSPVFPWPLLRRQFCAPNQSAADHVGSSSGASMPPTDANRMWERGARGKTIKKGQVIGLYLQAGTPRQSRQN
jgi:hypothetical protein